MKTWVFQSILMSAVFIGHAEFAPAQSGSPSDSKVAATAPGLAPRKLASGVMTVIGPDQDSEDTALGPFDLDFVAKHPELEWAAPDFPENKPHYASPSETLLNLSRDIILRHEVWGLEFSFKPVRLIEVDIPKGNGKFERKVVWYMIYKVRYKGEDLSPKIAADVPTPPEKVSFESVRFISRFTLLSKERKLNLDAQILPTAVDAIAAKERIGKPLLDHIEIGRVDIKASTLGEDNSVWGVATWTDVDPKLDFFAVDVRGLTNAYKIRIDEDGEKNFDRKTLRIYHWRPGDSIDESKDRILLGLPAYPGPGFAETAILKERRSGLIPKLELGKSELKRLLALDQQEKAQDIALEVLELDKQIRVLDASLRMRDMLDQFNLKERLDYQWIYR